MIYDENVYSKAGFRMNAEIWSLSVAFCVFLYIRFVCDVKWRFPRESNVVWATMEIIQIFKYERIIQFAPSFELAESTRNFVFF